MAIEDLKKALKQINSQLDRAMKRTIPVKLGAKAKSHFQQNFRLGGYMNNGLQPWKKSKRQLSGGRDAGYGTLLSRERNLFKSIAYTPRDYAVKIYSPLIYAGIHNNGGTITRPITSRMRKNHRGYALSKRTTTFTYIPKRQFMGNSPELNKIVTETIESEVAKALKL